MYMGEELMIHKITFNCPLDTAILSILVLVLKPIASMLSLKFHCQRLKPIIVLYITDIDECLSNACPAGRMCINTYGSYACVGKCCR